MVERMVSHYRIIDKVGEGGMGVVYRAHDTLLQRTVALNFISSTRLSSEKSREHFYREARAAAALEHENICSIHDIAESDGATFIVMAFCDGPTLRDMINEAPLPLEKAVPVIKDVARGLGCAHGKGIIHRDIKPSNIIVDPGRRQARIMDFGLAKTLGPGDEGTSTTRAGTIEYVSPEQIENVSVDWRTDIWSLGVTFFETLTGKRPFKGQYQASVIYSILNEEPDMSGIPPGPEGELAADIIARSLSKAPEDRYPDIDSFIADLERLERKLSTNGGTELPARPKRSPPWYSVRPLFILVILAVALPVVLWFDSLDERRPSPAGIYAGGGTDSLRSEADMMFE
ncbi:MAG TPA: serine/threonine-protein kinase, partial [Candidatus Krumholzibacterium sp.]|nr:serine/threonine-protein kinase [Candidatus Krumholzibacterium sp.]